MGLWGPPSLAPMDIWYEWEGVLYAWEWGGACKGVVRGVWCFVWDGTWYGVGGC